MHIHWIASEGKLPHVNSMTPELIFFQLRIPRSLKDAMKKDAERQNRSMNAHWVRIMQLYLDGELVPVDDLVNTPAVRNLIKAAVKEAVK